MHHGVTFNIGSAKVCSPALFEKCFSYCKDLWITATAYCIIILYLIVLVSLTAILQ